jgi:hypothetical protein
MNTKEYAMINSPARPMPSRSMRVRHAALVLALLGGLVASAAHAQDEVAVSDQTVRSNTGDIKNNTKDIKNNTSNISNQIGGSTNSGGSDTVNGHLKNIDTVDNGNAPASSSSAVAAPKVALVDEPTPDTSQCDSVATKQQPNCVEILKTQNSQYQYMKAMYDIATSREKDLKSLISARQRLQSEDFGKLEDNTNKMIAMRAQMDIDRQQMEAANNAYTLRLNYLQAKQTQLAQSANSGGGSNNIITNTVSQIVSGAVLKGALSLQQTNNGAQTLGIEDSNGF